MRRKKKELKPVDLGEVLGGVAVRLGVQPLLLLVTKKALVLMWPKVRPKRALLIGDKGERLLEARELVKLSRLKGEKLTSELKKQEDLEIAFFIPLSSVKWVKIKKGLLGGLKLEVETIESKKVDVSLVYGLGTGIKKEEALNLAKELLGKAGVPVTPG